MDAKELCEKFIAADKIINGENDNNLTMYQIIEDSEFNNYCDNQTCNTRKEIIGALSAYLFTKARVLATTLFETRVIENDDQYDEFFLMWLSDKLFKIINDENKAQINDENKAQINDENKAQINDITLYEAYEQYLKNNIVDSNKLDLLDKINGLKEVNLMYMKQFYKLLNPICKAIAYYNPNDDDNNKLIDYSSECYNQYSSLYDSVSECISYLRLLDNLKNTYYSFINYVINKDGKNEELACKLKTLKTSDGNDDLFAKGFNKFDFNCSECKPQKTQKDEPSHKNGSEGSKSKQQDSENSKRNTGDTPGNKENSNSETGSSDGGSGASETQSTLWSYFGIGSYISTIASKGKEQLNNAFEFFKAKKKKITETMDTIKNLYSTALTNLETAYDKSSSFLKEIIDNISSKHEKIDSSANSGDNKPVSDGAGDELPTPNDSANHQKHTSQTPLGTSPTSLSSPNPNDQTKALQSSQDQSGNKNSDQTDQGGPQKLVPAPMIKQENSGTGIKGNETTGIGGIYALKKYKQIGISIIVILIPITLAIMYKYLSFGRRKELKGKKNMKKVINSIGGKRPIQIIIKSYDRKKDLKPIINSVGRKKDPLLNIYKLMQADPIPFINLFFLLIFFVYKRQLNYLEL
ncbi:PIR protein CIR protein [Plasmodium vinckei brucechwatti]|uniref:PIR protein CIR protein n=1 Tax=Plasmodium vinckei brucechwatti TaxID=119398 RepID=A0A6V7S5U3_PLAVN|nr:PIR protein CIR protein [Plasmodium vinckei brucechwatti]